MNTDEDNDQSYEYEQIEVNISFGEGVAPWNMMRDDTCLGDSLSSVIIRVCFPLQVHDEKNFYPITNSKS